MCRWWGRQGVITNYLIIFKRLAGCHKPQILALSYLLPENAQSFVQVTNIYFRVKSDAVIERFLLLRLYPKWQLTWAVSMLWWENKKENSWRRNRFVQSYFFRIIVLYYISCQPNNQYAKIILIGSHAVMYNTFLKII